MSNDTEIVTSTPLQIINIKSAYLEQSPVTPDAAKTQPGNMMNSGPIAGWGRPRMDPEHVDLDLGPPGSLGHPRITIKIAKKDMVKMNLKVGDGVAIKLSRL